MPEHWKITAEDAAFFDRHLRDFVPDNVFDAHGHLYKLAHFDAASVPEIAGSPDVADWDAYVESARAWMGDKCPTGGLMFPYPLASCDVAAANTFIMDDLRDRRGSRALMLVKPGMDPAAVEGMLDADPWAGFKVYHMFADRERTMDAGNEEFLPEWVWELSNQRSLPIMLHMVRDEAMADPHNQKYIREHCLQYPNAKLILAHAARGFCGHHTVDGLEVLRGLDNVWFDTSAICDAAPLQTILRMFGPWKLMFGFDWPISVLRGRPVSVGYGFFWLYSHNATWDNWDLGTPHLIGIESLMALRQASRSLGLIDRDIELIFGGAARQMLGIADRSGQRTGHKLYEHAVDVIPSGVQLLSKKPEMYAPGQWPAYFAEARGCEAVDLDGNVYKDFSNVAVGASMLGYADPDVTDAVVRRVQLGSISSLNPPEEVELTDLLCEIHPWAAMARFTRAGGEAMATAVRIARARTKRDAVAICGYHGWSDWYIAANLGDHDALDGHLLPGLNPAGVPRPLRGTTLPFRYNQLDQLEAIVSAHGENLAAVIMEPTRGDDPDPGFLEGVREICTRNGTVLVFDEITIGWKLLVGGSHMRYGVIPDIAVFAKTISNGHPMGAIIGTAETMDAARDSFISSSYWTESVGPVAALATIRKMQRVNLPAHLFKVGTQISEGWAKVAERHHVPVTIGGHPEVSSLAFDHPEAAALTTLMTVRMLDRGYLAGCGYMFLTLAHEPRHVDDYLRALDEVFAELGEAIAKGDIEKRIGGPVKQTHFARLM